MKTLTLVLLFAFIGLGIGTSGAQCTLSVQSSNDYTVEISLNPSNLIVTMPCDNNMGYVFNVDIEHDISFVGNSPPPSLWTLQGELICDDVVGGNPPGTVTVTPFFDLPNTGGMGTTQTANASTDEDDCATATLASLGCTSMEITVHGPGINPAQVLTCDITMPIGLVDFTVHLQGDDIHAGWETSFEVDSDRFILQHSEDGVIWNAVADVPSRFPNGGKYSWVEESPRRGLSYYRLVHHDLDGTTTTSGIQTIELDPDQKLTEIFPNPVQHSIYIPETHSEIEVLDLWGRSILTLKPQEGTSGREVDLSSLKTGSYVIRIGDDFRIITKI